MITEQPLIEQHRRLGKSTRMWAAVKALADAGGGVPWRPLEIALADGTRVVWYPNGEVRTMR